MISDDSSSLIEARRLKKFYPAGREPGFRGARRWVKSVDDVSFRINEGETYSLVGETGSGKTTTARMVLRVIRPTGGEVLFRGKEVHRFTKRELREYRSSVQAVFQDPWSSMNPRMRVEDIIAEPLLATSHLSRREVIARVSELMENVGLPPSAGRRFPHEFSGGQRQRVAIARALSPNPKLIVLDEPVSALDVSIRAQIMNLLKDVQKRYGVAYLFITHNLATVRFLSHRVGVMYLGKIVEETTATAFFDNPMHPYTKALIAASLPAHPDDNTEDTVLTGEIPSPINVPSGCPFHPRCAFAMPQCSTVIPALDERVTAHLVSCHLYDAAAVPHGDSTPLATADAPLR
jgi:oligopeptide/dipeptide ABC transporter ATP-binding protein